MEAIQMQMILTGLILIVGGNDIIGNFTIDHLNNRSISGSEIKPVTFSNLRPVRSVFEQDSSNPDHKPQLTARHETDYTLLNCTVRNPRPNSEVYISCPALGNTMATGPCYQGCQPTKVCRKSGGLSESCVPNEQTVFCQKTQSSNGTLIILLRINRADHRLTGTWSCNHAGLESAKFEISLEKTISGKDGKQAETVALPGPNSRADPQLKEIRSAHTDNLDDRPLAYMRKPEVVFSVLTVLGISLIINLAFCLRCLVMRFYIDAYHEGAKNTNCLESCLCVPRGRRKMSTVRMTPLLPRTTNWGQITNPGGSYNGSMFYPSPNLATMPLLAGQQSVNELNGMQLYTTGSLPGTFKRQRQASFPAGTSGSSVGQLDMMFNQPFTNQSAVEPGTILSQQSCVAGVGDLGLTANYMPSYIRVPSVNAPSPNPSQRMVAVSNSTSIYQAHNMPNAGSVVPLNMCTPNTSQYILRMQPTIIGGHVVYDDVAAGTSSIAGNYNRSPNGSIIENSPAIFQVSQQNSLPNAMFFQETGPVIVSKNLCVNDELILPTSSSHSHYPESPKHAVQSPHPVPYSVQAFVKAKDPDGNQTVQNDVNFPNTQSNVHHLVAQPNQKEGNRPNIPSVNGVLK